jgi:urease accessory protein
VLALPAYLQASAANLVSAAVRLVPLGQTDGQRAIAALEPAVAEVASLAPACPLDEVGTAALMVDFCSMRHETQCTRLFRS